MPIATVLTHILLQLSGRRRKLGIELGFVFTLLFFSNQAILGLVGHERESRTAFNMFHYS